MDDEYEDWGDSFDDRDSSDWNDFMAGPDDEEIERQLDDIAYSYIADYYQEDDVHADKPQFEEVPVENTVRMEEIVDWLSKSSVARKIFDSEGFIVPRGRHVRLENGDVLELFEWLFQEGVSSGKTVAGYSVIYSESDSEYGESLSFSKVIIDAPFLPLNADVSNFDESDYYDPDIPF